MFSKFDNAEYSTPIKVIEKTTNKLQQKVVVGKGIISSILALPEFRNTTSKTHYRPYRVLPANVKTWVNKAISAINRTLTTNQVAKVRANASLQWILKGFRFILG